MDHCIMYVYNQLYLMLAINKVKVKKNVHGSTTFSCNSHIGGLTYMLHITHIGWTHCKLFKPNNIIVCFERNLFLVCGTLSKIIEFYDFSFYKCTDVNTEILPVVCKPL